MRRFRQVLTMLAVVGVAACAAERSTGLVEPPGGSFTTATRQLQTDKGTVSVDAADVTPAFFSGTNVHPMLGRFPVDQEFASAGRDVVVLNHQLWTDQFGSSPTIIGRDITVDGRPRTVIGIAPPGFSFPENTRIWLPKRGGTP